MSASELLYQYLNEYQFHIYNFSQLSNLKRFEYNFSSESLTIYEIVIKLYKLCFKDNSDEIIYQSIFKNNKNDNHIYFLTSGNKVIIYGFLWSDQYSYRIETVCKNLILNYKKLCFNLLLNLLIRIKKNFPPKLINLEVAKNNNSALECYYQLGFTGPIVNGKETTKYSNRGYLILERRIRNDSKISSIEYQYLNKKPVKEIKIDNKIITIKNFIDFKGNIVSKLYVKGSI